MFSTSKTLDWSCNPWTCFAWKWVPLPWLPWAFELQWKIGRIMSYLVHCALIEYSVHWLIWFTICPILIAEESKPPSATCSENYNIWFSAAGESSSLPGNLIQETRALPIGKLTRSHWPKLSKKRRPIFSQHKQVEKCSFAVKHLEPLIREEKGVSKGGWLEREPTLGQITIDSRQLSGEASWWGDKRFPIKWRQWCSFFIWK